MSQIVVIPIYKAEMDQYEKTSFMACCRLLGNKYPICLVTFSQLDVSSYLLAACACGVSLSKQLFDASYFGDIHGYNRLMMAADFYRQFLEYDYMLVYQLDAFIFRDELDIWCSCGYDYVGAPLFTPRMFEEISPLDLAMVGNGGFSLRKITVFAEVLTRKLSYRELVHTHIKIGYYITHRKRLLYYAMLWAGGRCRVLRDFLTHFVDEDRFFSCVLVGSPLQLKVPQAIEAMHFSFDNSIRFLYENNGRKLPFGCHGWSRGTLYETFYHNFITLEL